MPWSAEKKFRHRARCALEAGIDYKALGARNRTILKNIRAEIAAGPAEITTDRAEIAAAAGEPSISSIPTASKVGQHLYIMRRSDAPDKLKIGRSNDPVNRAATLQSGHCFHVSVLAMFPNAGSKEQAVHAILQQRRTLEGAGIEWFNVSLSQALSAVSMVLDQ